MTTTLASFAIELGLVAAAAAIACAALIFALRPILARYAIAHPNARSSHAQPTPQGGGIAVIAAVVGVVACALLVMPGISDHARDTLFVLAVGLGIAGVGLTDDVRPMGALPRLLLQAVAVGLVIATLPADLRIAHILPWWFERACLIIGGIWFVNLVNFMDGIDWMTVVEVVPLTVALGLYGLLGALPPNATTVAVALGGAMIGFAPFNRPVARLFLGDVGSLPIGLLLVWLLTLLATDGHLAAAILLPLYYLADTTVTLGRRLIRREPILQAHRGHFYQQAIDKGYRVPQIVVRVFAANFVLVALATLTLFVSLFLQSLAIGVGVILIGHLLWDFNSTKAKR
jgi:UDP-N-acetylmuramyl pentapeptide phosphotransferase/UDP-N-acetylglucosamine-1-phosphate transferase